MNFSVTVN